MKRNFISAALAATVLLLGASLSPAAENQAAAAGEAGNKESAKSAPGGKGKPAAKSKAVKKVDINSASLEELKKLPGIGDAEAKRIIAGRPYGSSAWLVTKQVLPDGTYLSIRDLIVARQPFKDGEKNAEIYRKLAEKEAAEQKASDKK